jgi:hypothetical protein
MAFIHECSCECTKSELDLFSVPPTQTRLEAASYCDYHPMTSMNDDAPIEFEIGGTGDDYNTYLFVRAEITKANGDDLEANDAAAPTNYFLHCLFSQVDIFLNGTQVTTSANIYAYRSMIEAMLSYGGDAKQSQLTSGLFHKDDAGRMNAVLLEGAINEGFICRRALIARSRVVDLMGRIHADIFFQDRYMLNEVNIKIKLTRSKDAFCLIAGERFAVRIVAAELIVRKVQLSPSVFLAHAKALEHGMAKYPIKRVVCKTFTIPAGFLDDSHKKLFFGQLPSRLVIGIVDNEAFNRTFGRNPFNFNNYNLSETGLRTPPVYRCLHECVHR